MFGSLLARLKSWSGDKARPIPIQPSPESIRAVAMAFETVSRWRFVEDPDLTTSLAVLKKICNGADAESGPAGQALRKLLIEGVEEDAEITFPDIGALAMSKGNYIGNMERLWRTSDPISRLEPTDENIAKIRKQVMEESGCVSNGRFRLDKEDWSGRLIARNTGTARRIAWLHCFDHDGAPIPAVVKPYSINTASMQALTHDYWVALLPSCADLVSLKKLVTDLKEVGMREIEIVGQNWSPACPEDLDRTSWGMLACFRTGGHHSTLSLALKDAKVPFFDLAEWLTRVASGQTTP